MEHYRCYSVYANSTQVERTSDTIEFFPQKLTMPYMSSTDIAIQAANELIQAIQDPQPATLFAQVGTQQLKALQQLADIFQGHSQQLPRVPNKNSQQLPRVGNTASPTATVMAAPARPPISTPTTPTELPPGASHRSPTRHIISQQTQEEANHIMTIDTCRPVIPMAAVPQPSTHWANAIIDPDTGASMEYWHLIKSPKHREKWIHSFANEFGRLSQGVGDRITGTNTIFFIGHDKIPDDHRKDVTYGRMICVNYRPQKIQKERSHLTVGGNLINYPGEVSTPISDTTTAKMVINSTISTPGTRYMVGDISNFYLGTPMTRYEYMKMPIALVPQEIIDEYNLMPLVHKDHIYIETQRGMYGLPQAGLLANDLLTERLAPQGYYQCRHTPGLWRHKWRPILFSLVVDDFGIKYVGKEHADHLTASIKQHYSFTTDWAGELYCGIKIKWDYHNHTVDLSRPGYVAAALHKFQHPAPKRAQDAPHQWTGPNYGTGQQPHCTRRPDGTPLKCGHHPSPTNHRNTALLCPSSRSHDARGTWHHCRPTTQRHRSHSCCHCTPT
jgi:hypothetical protein